MKISARIKVEPYWNVKLSIRFALKRISLIKVEPYWNVKRNECSALWLSLIIKVEPYWNVKEGTETIDFKISVLK